MYRLDRLLLCVHHLLHLPANRSALQDITKLCRDGFPRHSLSRMEHIVLHISQFFRRGDPMQPHGRLVVQAIVSGDLTPIEFLCEPLHPSMNDFVEAYLPNAGPIDIQGNCYYDHHGKIGCVTSVPIEDNRILQRCSQYQLPTGEWIYVPGLEDSVYTIEMAHHAQSSRFVKSARSTM